MSESSLSEYVSDTEADGFLDDDITSDDFEHLSSCSSLASVSSNGDCEFGILTNYIYSSPASPSPADQGPNASACQIPDIPLLCTQIVIAIKESHIYNGMLKLSRQHAR